MSSIFESLQVAKVSEDVTETMSFFSVPSAFTIEATGENSIVIKPNISRTRAKTRPHKVAVVDAYVFDDETVERLMSIEVEPSPVNQDSSVFDRVMDWIGKK